VATFASVLASGIGLLLSVTAPSANLSAGQEDFSLDFALVSEARAGVSASHQPIPIQAASAGCARCSSFADQLYGHLLIFPNRLDMGLLVGDKTRAVEVWNTRTDAQALTAVVPTALDGVTWTGDASPMAPLSSRFWNVTVDGTGAATLDGSLTWQFAAEQPVLPLTATRLVLVGTSPDWSEPVTEQIEYLTAINPARNRKEQRASLRAVPRRTQSYSLLLEGPEQTRFAHQLHAWAARQWAVPIWQDAQLLSAPLPAGSSSVPIATPSRDFEDGSMALIWTSASAWEALAIQTVSAGALALGRPTASDWPAGARVVPLRPGRLLGATQSARHAASLGHWPLSWSLDPAEGLAPGRIAASGLPTYQGLEVLTLRPNAAQDLSPAAERALEVVDGDVGPLQVRDLAGFESWSRPYTWTLQGHAAFAAFLGWLEARRGSATPFWMPTWAADLEQTADLGATEVNLLVKDTGYALLVDQHASRRDLVFWPWGAAPVYRRIVGSIAAGAGQEQLTLDSAFGSIRKVGDFAQISFLSLVRLDHDAVTVTWVTNDLAIVQMRVREVPA
jgi:hypothetical protein